MGEFHRIGQQVVENLADSQGITNDDGMGQLNGQFQCFLLIHCLFAEDIHRLPAQGFQIEGFLLKNPEEEGWLYDKVGKDAFTKEFAAGDRISMVLHGTVGFELPETDLEILFVIEDTHGNVLPDYVSQAKGNWKDLWFEGDYHYGELDVPMVPETPGSYVLTVYFNGGKVASMDFSIS